MKNIKIYMLLAATMLMVAACTYVRVELSMMN